MKIGFGCDHAAIDLKNELVEYMKEKGYECIGATMKLYDNEEIGISREKTCCSLDDIEDARAFLNPRSDS